MKKSDNTMLKLLGAFALGAAAGAGAVIAARLIKPYLPCCSCEVIPCDDTCDCCCEEDGAECCEAPCECTEQSCECAEQAEQ